MEGEEGDGDEYMVLSRWKDTDNLESSLLRQFPTTPPGVGGHGEGGEGVPTTALTSAASKSRKGGSSSSSSEAALGDDRNDDDNDHVQDDDYERDADQDSHDADGAADCANNTSTEIPKCKLEAEYLRSRRYGLSDDIVLHRKCIRAVKSERVDRDEVGDIKEPMFSQSQAINLVNECHEWEAMPCEPVELEVPMPFPERKYPELIFGVATSFDRMVDSKPQLTHWLRNTGVKLVAIVVDAVDHRVDLGRLHSFYADDGVDLVIARPRYTGLGVNEQHFTIVRDLIYHSTPETKWIGVIDDDTFFPSLYPLAEVLGQQDHNQPAYLGGLSDNMISIQVNGLLAYGGAGVFLSMPLAKEIEPNVEKCLMQADTNQGDALLKSCIYSETTTRLMLIPGLSQLDIRGDPSGFYESGRFPLSLHHWKTWHSAPVDQMARSVDYCGSCFLQRWRFDEDTVLSNGYSVTVYREGIDLDELNQTEATFDDSPQFEWSYGPLRPKATPEEKKSFYLKDSDFVDDRLRQVYIMRGPEKDEVLELWWEQ
ncbi:Protein of unknown function, DUF604 [Geosmithia morbida]|uniref:Glycosyltransferase family 31 protein n=1 Tax=Geosmithia morbida TaxID=1094350 RepID=A0A9P5D467_9HYPO|nr:Protein of unknown function, DUF604 [Geosmithia morbida]KAF4127008.1 Protein of unknown function, DUF604 [Geosmithia morbida]